MATRPLEIVQICNPPAGRVERSEGRVKCGKKVYKSVHPLRPKADSPRGRVTFIAIPFDTTIFVSSAIHEVYKTLFEAGLLVLVVSTQHACVFVRS